jgi:nitrogen fixation protein NifB
MNTTIESPKHPCFDQEASHSHARIHLPVAPKCNIQCNYCNRKYDCVNESRPGVTSSVLSPMQAVFYLSALTDRIENISVIGIAGPGDPFANPVETLTTIRLIKAQYPEKLFCLSTNGINLKPYINEISELGVSHVTLTINAVDIDILSKIYSWVRSEQKMYRGKEAAQVLLDKQLECIPLLKAKGITVKINTIILPGINDDHIAEVAKVVAALGADVMNCIPVIPNKDTAFEDMEEPSKQMIFKVRTLAKEQMPMMNHCSRCRADAAGLLGKDNTEVYGLLQEFASKPINPIEERPYIAVATREGLLVNMHLGEAESLYIFRQTPKGFLFVEERKTPNPGGGDFRWMELASLLKDCRALLAGGAGSSPLTILQDAGIRVIQMTGLIDEGLEAVYNGKQIKTIKKADQFKCGDACKGNAQGCA